MFDEETEIAILDKFLEVSPLVALCERLRNFPKKKVVLRGNCLGLEGAKVLGTYLSEDNTLEYLSLEWNQLGSSGANVISNALEKNITLTHLDLRNNNIKNDGAIALANSLAINRNLRSIDLRWNQIEDKGAIAFKSEILDRNPPLKFQISGNHLSANISEKVEEWLVG